jgi:hypothetical protein
VALLGTLLAAAGPVKSQTSEVSRVVDAAGGLSSNSLFTTIYAACQPGPVGHTSSSGNLNYSGFLNTFLLHPDLDNDRDTLPDENDPDDDDDGLSDRDELSGLSFDPVTGTDALRPDSDGDGASDGQEAAAGTDPWDLNSFFHITRIHYGRGEDVVFWQSRSGMTYSLLWTTNMLGFPSGARTAATVTASDGAGAWLQSESAATNVPGVTRRFYRISIPDE